MNKQDGHAPSPSEQILFAIWDAIERVRSRQGEAAARQLARAALALISEQAQPVPVSGATDATERR